jgi:hypothetical protein
MTRVSGRSGLEFGLHIGARRPFGRLYQALRWLGTQLNALGFHRPADFFRGHFGRPEDVFGDIYEGRMFRRPDRGSRMLAAEGTQAESAALGGSRKGKPAKARSRKVDESDQILTRHDLAILAKRFSFSKKIRADVKIKPGEDRRHIVAWQALRERMLRKLTGKTMREAALILEKMGHEPKEHTKTAVVRAARRRLRAEFNDFKNLWAGNSEENQARGRSFSMAYQRAEIAPTRGERKAF